MLTRNARHQQTADCSNCGRHGLTAVELVVASTISTLLIVGFLGLVARMSSRHEALTANREMLAWRSAVATQLDHDIARAHTIHIHPRGFILDGFVATDETTGSPLHESARIVYRLDFTTDIPILLRDIQSIDENAEDAGSTNVVANGARQFEFFRFDTSARVWRRESWSNDEFKRIDLREPIRLVVIGGEPDDPLVLLDHVLVREGVGS